MTSENQSIRTCALVVTTISSLLTPLMGSALNIALPSIGREFKVDALTLSWVATAYALAAAVALAPFGRLADIYGRKKIFTWGLAVFTAASGLCAFAPGIFSLIAFRALQGAGGAMIFATGIAILTSVYPLEERGRVLGINVASVYVGLSLGPILGGMLTRYLSWQSIFLAVLPLGFVSIILTLTKLSGEWAEARGEKFDGIGSLIYGGAVVALMLGLTALPAIKGGALLLAGMVGAVVFIVWETRIASPIIRISLFCRNRVFAFSSLAALINYCATFAVGFLLSLYLQTVKGLEPQTSGLILIAQPIMMALFSPWAGKLSDRFAHRIIASFGMSLTAVGLILFTFLTPETSPAYIIGGLIVLGLGFAFFSSPNTNAIMSAVEKKSYGMAAGLVATMRLWGQMSSLGLVAMIFALFMGKAAITPETFPLFMKSVRTAFLIFSLLCLAGIFASLVRGEIKKRR